MNDHDDFLKKQNLFLEYIDEKSKLFLNKIKNYKRIRLISHLDTDGITACAIMIKTLQRLNKTYNLSIMQQISEETTKQLADENYDLYIFTDLGSGQIKFINENIKKDILILDHHEIQQNINESRIIHVNPHLFDIDGSKDISGAGVVYLFSKSISRNNIDLSYLALIGATGDIQEDNGFTGLNKLILEDAVSINKIKVHYGLRFFGAHTKPLYKLIQYSNELNIPEINNEDAAINFLIHNNIEPFDKNGKFRKLIDLNPDEMSRLITAIMLNTKSTNTDELLGPIYELVDEKPGSPMKDIREYSTLLNACGRMNQASVGIGCCLNDSYMKKKALRVLSDYKSEIMKSLKWYRNNKSNPNFVINGDNYVIINAKNQIKHTIIGTMASIISKSNELKDNTLIMSLARQENGFTKVSLRIANSTKETDLRNLIDLIISEFGESGGHKDAAGAVIKTEFEDQFINKAKNYFDKILKEELINEVLVEKSKTRTELNNEFA